jgi:hypothetical protein
MSLNDRERVGAFWLFAVAVKRSIPDKAGAFWLLAVVKTTKSTAQTFVETKPSLDTGESPPEQSGS